MGVSQARELGQHLASRNLAYGFEQGTKEEVGVAERHCVYMHYCSTYSNISCTLYSTLRTSILVQGVIVCRSKRIRPRSCSRGRTFPDPAGPMTNWQYRMLKRGVDVRGHTQTFCTQAKGGEKKPPHLNLLLTWAMHRRRHLRDWLVVRVTCKHVMRTLSSQPHRSAQPICNHRWETGSAPSCTWSRRCVGFFFLLWAVCRAV